MKNTCPCCRAPVVERTSRRGWVYFACSFCDWTCSWEEWAEECDRDPDVWNYNREMTMAEMEATNPNA